jgi:hypothetical protein
VFDLKTRQWTSYNFTSSPEYELSDLAGFSSGLSSTRSNNHTSLAYFTGGFDQNYTAQSYTFAIDAVPTTQTGELVTIPLAPLPTPRGDCGGASMRMLDNNIDTDSNNQSDYRDHAIVVGGFTDANNFCQELNITERYDFETDAWTKVGDLNSGRADNALVVLNDCIYAIGGERQMSDLCYTRPENRPEPVEVTGPVKDVEYFDGDTNRWTEIQELPGKNRFRFAAIAYNGTIYSFGGQLDYNNDCNCFPNSDDIILYKEKFETVAASGASGIHSFCFIVAIYAVSMWTHWM